MRLMYKLYAVVMLLTFLWPGVAGAQSLEEVSKVLPGEWKSDTVSTFLGSIAYDYIFYRDGTGKEETFHLVMGEPDNTNKTFKWVMESPEKVKLIFSDGVVSEKSLTVVNENNIRLGSDEFRRIATAVNKSKTPAKSTTTKQKSTKKTQKKSGKKSYRKIAQASVPAEEESILTDNSLKNDILKAAFHPLGLSPQISDITAAKFENYLKSDGLKFFRTNTGTAVSFVMSKEASFGVPTPLYLKDISFYKSFTSVTYSTTINGATSELTRQNKEKYAAELTEALREAGFQGEKISGDGNEYSKFRIDKKDYIVVSVNESPYSCSVDLDFFLH